MNMNPNSAQDRASNPHPALGLAFRVDQIITALRHLINARAPLLGIFFMPLHLRLGRSMRRLTTLLTRLATGQYPSPRPARPSQHSGPPPIQLPRSHAWIVAKLGYQAAAYASHLEHLLRDPDMLQLLAAAPPNAVIETTRDERTFPLWYAQAILGDRPDLTIRDTRGLAPVLRGGVQAR